MEDNPSFNRCYSYGSGHGCDSRCPVLIDGECEAIYEIIDNMNDIDDDLNDIVLAYPPEVIQYLRNKKISEIFKNER